MEYNVLMGTIDGVQLTPTQNKLLYALVKKDVVDLEQMNEITGNLADSRVCVLHIYRLNKKLKKKFKVFNKRWYGYYLTDEIKDRIKLVNEPMSKKLTVEIADKIVEEMSELEKDIKAERIEMSGHRIVRIKELQKQLNEKIKLIYG